MTDVREQVLGSVSTVTGRDIGSLSAETVIESLGLDSLDEVEILMTIEERLGVAVDQAEVNSCRTLGDLMELVVRAKAA